MPGIVGMPTDPAATAGTVLTAPAPYASAIVDGVLGSGPGPGPRVTVQGDPSGGLVDLANWGADILAANPGSSPRQAPGIPGSGR
jgi:hypothetical protein